MSRPLLSIVCVTQYEPHVYEFMRSLFSLTNILPSCELIIGADGERAQDVLLEWPSDVWGGCNVRLCIVPVKSDGYIESVLDQVLELAHGQYVLRLDDDEELSPAAIQWLLDGQYLKHDHWKFSRAHLWPDGDHYITDLPLWPDHQTRLSLREKAGGRKMIHAGSPFGGGELAPVVLTHRKFLVRTELERLEIAQRYDKVQLGAGTSPGMRLFQLPDLEQVTVEPLGIGIDVNAVVDEAYQVGVFQQRGELEELVRWLAQRHLHNVLEIGTLHGGTAGLWHNLSSGKVITVDLPNGRFGGADHGYDQVRAAERSRMLQSRYPRVRPVLGNSHDEVTIRAVAEELAGQRLGLLFIDGDHTYEGVKRDLELYRPLLRPGGAIVLHDVLDTPLHRAHGCEVHRLWAELSVHKAVMSVNGEWGGIGVTFA